MSKKLTKYRNLSILDQIKSGRTVKDPQEIITALEKGGPSRKTINKIRKALEGPTRITILGPKDIKPLRGASPRFTYADELDRIP